MLDAAMAEFWPEAAGRIPREDSSCGRGHRKGSTAGYAQDSALEHVAYVPGVNFYPDEDGGENAMWPELSTRQTRDDC